MKRIVIVNMNLNNLNYNFQESSFLIVMRMQLQPNLKPIILLRSFGTNNTSFSSSLLSLGLSSDRETISTKFSGSAAANFIWTYGGKDLRVNW